MKEGWGIGTRADPIDPKRLKYRTEQEEFRRLRPLRGMRTLGGWIWAALSWPGRIAMRLVRGRAGDGDAR